jgi:hypothetical protein
MWRKLESAGWIVAFLLFAASFVGQIVKATNEQHNAAIATASSPSGMPWVCPIAGQCGPPGTPGLGRW